MERKRQKKLRQKEHRANGHSSGNKSRFKSNASDIAVDILIDNPEKSLRSLNITVEDASVTCEFESGDHHMQIESGQIETTVFQTPPLSKSTNLTNNFQKIPTTKCVLVKKTHMVWTEKNKTESSDKVELVTKDGSNHCNNSEVLIGSIPVSVGNNHNLDVTTERLFKPNAHSLSNCGCHPSVKQWKPVNKQEGSTNPLALQNSSVNETKLISSERNSLYHGENGSIDEDIVGISKVRVGSICPTTQRFSSQVAMDFLTQSKTQNILFTTIDIRYISGYGLRSYNLRMFSAD